MKPTIGTIVETGKPQPIDIDRLLLTRMLLQADSGGGKTVALKRLLEQTHGHVQQIIIDPEGEFSTLREKFDYLLCAPEGADAIANPKTAPILARKLRETRVSAVIDIYDLRPQEQKHFVRLFIEELLAAPKSLWNPCLLIIDEAQIFAPEGDKAESLGAIMDLRGRGRKRGLCPILATPRLAELSKDACAGLQNKLIGVTTLDLDVKRAARDLALTPSEATTMLRNLEPGEFFCFGPALNRNITKVKVGNLTTAHGQHLAGKDKRPPAPSEKIKAVLAKLADLPKEAEQEAKTLADFKTENARLKRELTIAKKAEPKAPAAKRIEVPVLKNGEIKQLKLFIETIANCAKHYNDAKYTMESALGNAETIVKEINSILQKATSPDLKFIDHTVIGKMPQSLVGGLEKDGAFIRIPKSAPVSGNGAGLHGHESLSRGQQKILDALSELQTIGVTSPNRSQLGMVAGYNLTGGSGAQHIADLGKLGLVEIGDGAVYLTEQGRAAANSCDAPTTLAELHERVLRKLSAGQRRIAEHLISIYPEQISRADLGTAVGYNLTGGSGAQHVADLVTVGSAVIPSKGYVKASDLLFPEGLQR